MQKDCCIYCGAPYEYEDGKWKCAYCGAYKPEELSNEEVTLLYNTAQKLRLNAFDDAEEMYRDIIRKYPQNSEGYWGLVLSKYGIKYEQDYDGKMIPTCYAASYDSILSDKDYKRALDLASKHNREYYEAQAQKIEAIRKEWIEKASKEQPYDIFISYKDTELENGVDRTEDSYEAFELYAHLQSLGYRVFYSRESLKGKVGEKYEPYIFNALNTAHAMIVFGSKPEYVESMWIKNEWSRFYKRIKNGQKQSNALIVVYKGFNPGSLPRPLNSVQSIDRNSLTFLNDLDAYVARVVGASKESVPHIERVEVKAKNRNVKKTTDTANRQVIVEKRELGGMQVAKLTASAEKKIIVADTYLQSGQFDEAEKAYSEFLIDDKNNGRALVGKLLASVQCASIDTLTPNSLYTFEDWALLDKILHLADRTTAEAILRVLCELATMSVPANALRAKDVCEQVCAYDLPCVAQMREKLFAFGVEKIATSAEAKCFVDTALLYEQDGSAYIKKLLRVAESCVKSGSSKLAEEYYAKAIESAPTNSDVLLSKLCASVGCASSGELYEHIQDLTNFTVVEDWLASVPEREFVGCLELLLGACLRHISLRNNSQDNVDKVVEKLLAYIPQGDDSKLIVWLKKFADEFKRNGDFAVAQRFYAMVIAADSEDHAAYWGILQAKLKCKTDDDVIAQPEPLADYSEFQNALVASASNREAMAHYIDVQGKQKEWIANKAKKDKTDKRRKKITVITSIALAIVLLICGAIGGGVLYYNSENQLKYTAVDGGYAVSAGKYYHNSVSGKFTIPDNYNGKPVVEIADGAFEDFDKVTAFVIPDTVTKIGNRAFANTAITEISVSPAVEYIGANAFSGCDALKVIHIPERMELPSHWSADWKNGNNAKVEFQIKVTYDYNGATSDNSSQSVYVVYGDAYTFAVPLRNGYTFDGWYRGEQKLTDEKGVSVAAWEFSEGSSVQAHWTANENLITFNGNGATSGSMRTQKIKTDDSVSLLQNEFVRKGYTFAGWATSATGGKEYGDKAVYSMGTQSTTTLYAVWTPNENSVVFHANGGSGNMSAQSIKTDATANLKTNTFTRNGYTFAGWATSETGNKTYNDKASYKMGVEDNYNLYAVWTPTKYTLTYNLDGGTVSGNATQYTIESDSFTLANPTRAGYTFAGWTGTELSGAQTTVTVQNGSTGNRTYTATWTANINTVTFHANGGEGSMQPQEIATDANTNLSENIFTRNGYEFVGWATSASGSKVYNNSASYKMGVNSNYDLYAVWNIKKYTITYILNGGMVSGNPTEYTVESNSVTLKNPTRAGYTFVGWSGTDINGAQTTVSIDKGSVDNREYTANWSANINTITFHANGGDGEMQPQKIATDATENLSQNKFTRKGYSFVGWSTIQNGAKVYDDLASYKMGSAEAYALYAVWQIETYTITYTLDGGNVTGNLNSYNVNTADFTLNNPTRKGYTFAGWSGTDIADNTQAVTIENGSVGDRAYTANWEIIEYTISYNLNGGTVADNTTTYTVESDTFTVNNPTKTGYAFMGWSGTDITGTISNLHIAKGSIGDREYEAVFEANEYTVTFKPNGGKCDVDKMTVKYDENFVIPETKRFAYDFLGWYNGDTLFEDCVWNYESNVTLTAKWQKQEIIEIYTAEDLSMIVYELSGNYILQADIDLDGEEWDIIGDKPNPFTGVFDGNHHTISNFTISKTADYVGFFGANSGTIKNLRINGANVTSGTLGSGILVGYSAGRVEECSISGNINNNEGSVGGLIGLAEGGTVVYKVSVMASVSGHHVGGLIGETKGNANNMILVENSYFNGEITIIRDQPKKYYHYAGTLIARASYTEVNNCYSEGCIGANLVIGNGSSSLYFYIGGIIGCSGYNVKILNSYTNLRIDIDIIVNSGYMLVGGVLGGLESSAVQNITIGNCFSYIYEKNMNISGITKTYFHGIYAGSIYGNASVVVINNSYRYSDDDSDDENRGTPTSLTNFKSPNFIKDILGWDDEIWILENGEFPKLNLYNWEE